MRALILSAGFGNRLKPYTEYFAKPSIPFLNVPILAYPMFLCEKAGVTDALINLHHLPESVRSSANDIKTDLELSFTEETPNILDSGGGIKNAQSFFEGEDHFWVLNGDTTCFFRDFHFLTRMKEEHLKNDAIATILTCPYPEDRQSLGGVFVKGDGSTIDHFSRTDRGTGLTPFHYIGVGIYSKKIFDYLPEGKPSNIFYDGLTTAMADGHKAQVIVENESLWLETGNPSDFLEATSICLDILSRQEGKHRDHLCEVLKLQNPLWEQGLEVTDDYTVLKDPRAQVYDSSSFRGFAVFGKDTVVSKQCVFEDVVVLPPTQIQTSETFQKQIVFTPNKIS